MKRIKLLVTAFLVTAIQVVAQDRDQIRLQEHLMLIDGKMYQVRDQDKTELKDQLQLKDGTRVNPDGSVQYQDQKQIRLKLWVRKIQS